MWAWHRFIYLYIHMFIYLPTYLQIENHLRGEATEIHIYLSIHRSQTGKSRLWVGAHQRFHPFCHLSTYPIYLSIFQIECLMWGAAERSRNPSVVGVYLSIYLQVGGTLLGGGVGWGGDTSEIPSILPSVYVSNLSIHLHLQIECLVWGAAERSTFLSTTNRETLLWWGFIYPSIYK